MEKIVIIGVGGFGREVKMLIDQINHVEPQYVLMGFYDDAEKLESSYNGIKYLGRIEDLNRITEKTAVVLGIGDPKIKSKIINRIDNRFLFFPTLVHPTAIVGADDVEIGLGTIITAGCIITCNIKIGNFVTLNLFCTVGHDTEIKDYASFMPSVNISGEVIINKNVYVGTGAKIINQLEIGVNSIIGAGAVVSKSIPDNCTAVGIPAKPIKFHDPT